MSYNINEVIAELLAKGVKIKAWDGRIYLKPGQASPEVLEWLKSDEARQRLQQLVRPQDPS